MNKILKTHNSNGGFSLLELAIVIAVVGIALSSGLKIFGEYAANSKRGNTNIKIDEIMLAIDKYVGKYKRLPCPADPTIQFNNQDYGKEVRDGSGGCTAASALKSGDVVMGMVPVTTLNLYPTLALDGWNNRLTYVVREGSTVGTVASPEDLVGNYDEGDSELNLSNYDGVSKYEDVVVIVMSHGDNGFGAYSGRGGASRLSPTGGNAQEDNNNNPANTFHSAFNNSTYDDILKFWTIHQIEFYDE